MSRKAVVLKKAGRWEPAQDTYPPGSEGVCKIFFHSRQSLYRSGCAEALSKAPIPFPPNETVKSETLPARKGKWAEVAERISREGYLTGLSDKLQESGREFRESFMTRDE